MKRKKQKTVKASELSTLKMTCGNENKYSKVICNGMLKEWVGIGWIDIRIPANRDFEQFPVVK